MKTNKNLTEQVRGLIKSGNIKELDILVKHLPPSFYKDELSKKDVDDSILHLLMNGKVPAYLLRIALENGANPNLLDWKERTPIFKSYSLERGNENIEKVKLLLEFGADISVIDANNCTFLMHNFDARILSFIDLKKFDLEHKDYKGNTIIDLMIEGGIGATDYKGFVKIVSAFSDVNYYNSNGVTPLHKAALLFCPLAIQVLLEKGADASLKTKQEVYSEHSDSERAIPKGLTALQILDYMEANPELLVPEEDLRHSKYVTIRIMHKELQKTKRILLGKRVRVYPYFATNLCYKLGIPIGY